MAISPSQLFFRDRMRAPVVSSSFKFLVLRPGNFSFRSCTSLSFITSLNPSPRLVRPLFQNSFYKLFSTCPRFLFFGRAPSMEINPRCQGKDKFSAKSSGDNKEILVQHLLVGEKELELLIELEHRIAGGELLSDLAVQYSICPSKVKGGMLGWVRRGQLVPDFENAAFCTSLNKVVRCKTQYGWHLLEILSEREESRLEDIEPLDLHSKMQDSNFIKEAQLIDVREQEEIVKASLAGFKAFPLLQFGTWGPVITDEFDPEKEIYVLCHHGVRSMQVAKWLQTQGFKRVFNVAGGIHAYSLNVDPSVPTY